MDYRVSVEATAQRDALEYAAYILSQGSGATEAMNWLDGLERSVAGLGCMPRRFRVIAEQDSFTLELRQLLHSSHRVIYHVNDATQTVHVLRVYHGHRDALRSGEV